MKRLILKLSAALFIFLPLAGSAASMKDAKAAIALQARAAYAAKLERVFLQGGIDMQVFDEEKARHQRCFLRRRSIFRG